MLIVITTRSRRPISPVSGDQARLRQEVERVLLYDFMSFLSDTLGSWPPEPCFLLSGRWGNNTEAGLESCTL